MGLLYLHVKRGEVYVVQLLTSQKKKEQKAYFITVNASVVLDFNRPHLGRHTGLGLFLLPMIEYTVDKVYLIRSELSDGGSFIWPPSTLHQN